MDMTKPQNKPTPRLPYESAPCSVHEYMSLLKHAINKAEVGARTISGALFLTPAGLSGVITQKSITILHILCNCELFRTSAPLTARHINRRGETAVSVLTMMLTPNGLSPTRTIPQLAGYERVAKWFNSCLMHCMQLAQAHRCRDSFSKAAAPKSQPVQLLNSHPFDMVTQLVVNQSIPQSPASVQWFGRAS